MNPMTNMKNVKKLSEQELHRTFKTSWHDQYKDSAWIFVGGLPYDLTEGDIICIFSQYGEVVNINLVRDKDTGKQKGFCFICYEDQKSTVLAVDNFNGIKILKRTIRVDHVNDYKMPKDHKNSDAETRKLHSEGCGPDIMVEKRPLMPIPSTELPLFAREIEAPLDGFRLPPRLPIGTVKIEKEDDEEQTSSKKVKVKKEKKHKKDKKNKKKKSKRKHKKANSSEDSNNSSSSDDNSTGDSDNEEDKAKEEHKRNKETKNESSDTEQQRRSKKSFENTELGRMHRKDDDKYKNYQDSRRPAPEGRLREERTYGKNEEVGPSYPNQYNRGFDGKYNENRFIDDKYKRYDDRDNEKKRRPDDRRESNVEVPKRYRR